jgi:hypothetical protein
MEDKQKLAAAILGAIITYLQIEQASSAAPVAQSPKEAEGQQRS